MCFVRKLKSENEELFRRDGNREDGKVKYEKKIPSGANRKNNEEKEISLGEERITNKLLY